MNSFKPFYRIFDDINGQPATLFHSVNGSRILRLDEWHIADAKQVRDGSGDRYYESGFHVLPTLEIARTASKRFKKLTSRVICKVIIDIDAGIQTKAHAKVPTMLAHRMFIFKEDWSKRILLNKTLNRR